METFSDALLSLARGHLGGAIEQYSVFQQHVRPGPTRVDHRSGLVWLGEREFTASGELGTYAEDHTFQWAWAKPAVNGTPGAAASIRLRELGLRHGIPEFATELVDLSRFPDPQLAADHLAIIALGVLGVRGMTKFNHGGRAYAYLLIDDESVPVAEPDPGLVAGIVRGAAQMLPGGGARSVVAGYARRHHAALRDTADGMEVQLPDGYRLVVRLHGEDLLDVRVVDAGRGTVDPAAPSPRPERIPPFLPDPLLSALAAPAAITVGGRGSLRGVPTAATVSHLWWEPMFGDQDVVEVPDRPVAVTEIGGYDNEARIWTWAGEGSGVSALRELAREHGAAHLAGERVDLGSTVHPDAVVTAFVAAATHLGGAPAWAALPDGSGWRYFAITDQAVRATGTDPGVAALVIETAADLLHPLTDPDSRYATMRAMVTGYLDRYRVPTLTFGEPQMLIGQFGLYELRVEFDSSGGVLGTRTGMLGELMI
ncbi:DUF6882 domain-containing protein [Nocardia sp. AG03]|uniref:DUF6882 domain-containing protein n=1 Tax=Nocardia sp. AG03 TaxID=3025312 RepID=UPI002418745D|nr:DUF6882 domain-containing protein [Nocardia sp. AG03]